LIKVYNQKSLNDIEELREKGLYNAPFSVQENANGIKIESPDTKALEEKVANLEEKLARSEETVADYVKRTEDQAKTIEELNSDLDALVGGSDE
jgi:myosin heavy chain